MPSNIRRVGPLPTMPTLPSLPTLPTLQEAIESTPVQTGTQTAYSQSAPNFADVLLDAFTETHSAEKVSEDMALRFAQGDPNVGMHEVMISAEKANISLRYAVTLKNKAIEAYRELMNTQL